MRLNNQTQLAIEDSDVILPEQHQCPVCGTTDYTTLYMEKFSGAPQPFTITEGPVSRVYTGKCPSGHTWLEEAAPAHHRPRIQRIGMRSYGSKA